MANVSPVSTNDPVIKIGAKEYTVRKFVLAKAIKATDLIAKLAEDGDVITSLGSLKNPEVLIKQIPLLLRKAAPYVYQLCALILTNNAKIRELEESDESLDAYLTKFATDELKYNEEFGVSEVVETIVVGIEQVGVQSVRKNLERLQKAFQTS